MRVDQREEWAQILDESWRVMKYRFYDEKMHGKDWNAIRAKYEPLLKYVGANEDVYDLANEMIGELNASHTGVSGPPTAIRSRAPTRRAILGFEMEPDAGGYRVAHIYRDGPADKEWLDLKVGDYVLGDRRHADQGRRQLLAAAQQPAERLRHGDASPPTPAGAGKRDVRHALGRRRSTTSSTRSGSQKNREIVDKETNGQIAYVHIQSMNQPSLVRFQNEINQFWNKKGIIVDIRYNGGGNIDQELIDILERRPYEYWNSRWGAPELGPPAAAGDRRAEGHADQLALGLRQRSHADGVQAARPRPARRQPDGGGGHRDRLLRADQRRLDPHAGLAGRDLRPASARTTTASTSRTSAWRPTCGSRTRPRTS